jgi:hypothetical protein
MTSSSTLLLQRDEVSFTLELIHDGKYKQLECHLMFLYPHQNLLVSKLITVSNIHLTQSTNLV